MPNYDYNCPKCFAHEERRVEHREVTQTCHCGATMKRQFPVEAAKNFQPFEAYYDEALDVDVTGREDKRHKMAALGVVEAGDKVGGARDFDANAPHHIKPLPPRGAKLKEKKAPENWDVGVQKDGKTVDVINTGDLPDA